MYFFYICNLTNDYTKMKKKIMNVCGMAFLAISVLACSGQKKGATDTVDRKSTRLNSSHPNPSRMPSSA